MATLAGHGVYFGVDTTDGSYNEVDGINDLSMSQGRDELSTTDFKDTTGAKTRMAGLADVTVTVSGDVNYGDTGQDLIRTQYANGGALWTKILFDTSTNGFKFQGICLSYEHTGVVDGKVQFSATILGNAAVTAIP